MTTTIILMIILVNGLEYLTTQIIMKIFITALTRIILLLFSIVIVFYVDESKQGVSLDVLDGLTVVYPQFVNIGVRSKRDGAINYG